MKSSRTLLIVVVLLLAVVAIFSRSSAQNAPVVAAAKPTCVSVCDVAAVFNKYQRAKDLNEEFTQKRKTIAAEDKIRIDEIKQLEEMVKGLEPGSKIHEQKSTQLQELALKQSVWRKIKEQTAMRWHRRLTEEMYREILIAIETVAKKRGCDLVMHREDIPIPSQTTTELLNKIAQRKCLYHNPAIDLTDDVLNWVNSQYAKRPK